MRIIPCILFCLLLASCKPQEKIPGDVIPREKFVSLLIRMHLLDARFAMEQNLSPATENQHYAEYETLMKKYGTDSTGISHTFDYYHDKQDELQDIYEEVQDSLKVMAEQSVKKK